MRCEICKEKVASLAAGLEHLRKEHGLTRQQAQNERKVHAKHTKKG